MQAASRPREGPSPRVRKFRDVTPLSRGRRFSLEQLPTDKPREILFVNAEAMRVLEAHGGQE